MNETTKNLLIGAAIAGVMGLGSTSALAKHKKDAKAGHVECAENNACKGNGGCTSASNECAGKNSCKGHTSTQKSEKDCKAIQAKNEAAAKPGAEAPKAN